METAACPAPPSAAAPAASATGPQVVGLEARGLERSFVLVLPAPFMAAERARRLEPLQRTGWGTGLTSDTVAAVKRRIEASITAAILSDAVETAVRRVLRDRGERPAGAPRSELLAVDSGNAGDGDLRLRVRFEVLPTITVPDLSAITLERLVAEPGEAELTRELEALARRHGALEDAPEDHRAGPGDVVVCDYAGRVETFPPSLITNPTAEGLIPGRPGRHPTDWSSSAPAGVSVNMVGSGFEAGIPYADIRFIGTFGAGTNARIFFARRGAIPADAAGRLRLSVNVALSGGVLPPGAVARLVLDELGAEEAYVAHGLSVVPLPTDGPLADQRPAFVHAVKSPAARSVLPRFEIGFPEGADAADFTLRLGLPELTADPPGAPTAPVWEPLPGGTRADAEFEIGGAGGPVPGLGDHLEGLRRGEARAVGFILPDTGVDPVWAGRRAEFDVTVKAVRRPVVDDALARTLGLPGLPALRERVREELRRRYRAIARARLKAELLDRLAELVGDVTLPPALLRAEEDGLWQEFQAASRGPLPRGNGVGGERARRDEAALRAECRAMAARRIRLRLLFAEIARIHRLEVTEAELAAAVRREAARHPGREPEVLAFYRNRPEAADELRGPVLEEKIVDLVLSYARITERKVPPDAMTLEAGAPPSAGRSNSKEKQDRPEGRISDGARRQWTQSTTALLCVASIGRSGTTFLQRLLNTHPEILVFGEHDGFLTHLRTAYNTLTARRVVDLFEMSRLHLDNILKSEPVTVNQSGWSIEWTNAVQVEAAAPLFARLIQDLIYPPEIRSPAHRYWGFKEIRYGVKDLSFLAKVFPDARFLIIVRDPVAVYRSQCRLGWARQADPRTAAAEFHRSFLALAETWDVLRGSDATAARSRLICYERLAADPSGHLKVIADWLALAPFAASKVAAVVASEPSAAAKDWTAEMASFHDAYTTTYGDLDRRRYEEMISSALDPKPFTGG